MDQGEIHALLHRIDQKIGTSEPRRAEYWRGYRQGVLFRFQHKGRETLRDPHPLHDVTDENDGDPYLDAYARGYRDGCEGKKPEDTP